MRLASWRRRDDRPTDRRSDFPHQRRRTPQGLSVCICHTFASIFSVLRQNVHETRNVCSHHVQVHNTGLRNCLFFPSSQDVDYSAPDWRAEYCDKRVRLSVYVCLVVFVLCVSVRAHISETNIPIFSKFSCAITSFSCGVEFMYFRFDG